MEKSVMGIPSGSGTRREALPASFRDLVHLCLEVPQETFCLHHPHPLLLYSTTHRGSMTPVKKTRTPTVDRLVVGETPSSGVRPAAPIDCYLAFEVAPRRRRDDRITLGCSSECDVRLDDASISRVHAHVTRTAHGYYLEDADSSSGTALNGSTLESGKVVELRSGDRISLGNVDLVFLPATDFHSFVRRLSRLWRS